MVPFDELASARPGSSLLAPASFKSPSAAVTIPDGLVRRMDEPDVAAPDRRAARRGDAEQPRTVAGRRCHAGGKMTYLPRRPARRTMLA